SALNELDNIGPTGYNIIGFDLQSQVQMLNYILPGLLIVVFGVLLSKRFKKSSASFYGSLSVIISGLGWLSYGLVSIDPNGGETLLETIRVIQVLITWTSMILSMILISIDLEKLVHKTFKWITFLFGIMLISETVYQLTLDSLYSGVISTLGYSVFFSWFLVFAITMKRI
ncbi:DUF998 domain-containing protein, partial [Fulvivirga lutimaris]|uniref:DUF998 domain-containing protein n=1 Tax=Fulvivirga lutimaris TaxID=1819566 RepID=UPI001C87A1F0